MARLQVRSGEAGQKEVDSCDFADCHPSMIKLIVLIVGLASLVLAQNDPDNQSPQVAQTVDTVTMQLVGNSGQIKLFPSSDSNRFIIIRMSQLVEVDASSSPVPGPNNNVNFASLAQRNACGSGAGWSPLQKQTSSSGANFY